LYKPYWRIPKAFWNSPGLWIYYQTGDFEKSEKRAFRNPDFEKSGKGLARNPPFRSKFHIKMCTFLEPVFLPANLSLPVAGQSEFPGGTLDADWGTQ
jgi:hypothetical protein